MPTSSVFDEASRRLNIESFLRRQGLDVFSTEGGEIHVRDPRCDDRKPRLYINLRTKRWICHRCQHKGMDAISCVRYLLRVDEYEAIRLIAQASDSLSLAPDVDEPRRRTQDNGKIDFPSGWKPLILPMDVKSEPYWRYLIDRSITPTMVMSYEMGYVRRGYYHYERDGEKRQYAVKNRIVLPIDIFGVRRGWVGRTIVKDLEPKYLNPPDLHMSRLLFNLDNVLRHGTNRVVLVEGVFDALRIPDQAVCTFGKKLSREQASILDEAGFDEWVFCYDGDAIADARRFAEMAPFYVSCLYAELPKQYDPGNAPMTVLQQALKNARSWDRMRAYAT